MSAVFRGNVVRNLDRAATTEQQIQPSDITTPMRLLRLVQKLLEDVAALKSRWAPGFLDFEDVTVDATGTTKYNFAHNFGSRARWFVVGWKSTAGTNAKLDEHSTTTNNTLVLVSTAAGLVTVRVERAG